MKGRKSEEYKNLQDSNEIEDQLDQPSEIEDVMDYQVEEDIETDVVDSMGQEMEFNEDYND